MKRTLSVAGRILGDIKLLVFSRTMRPGSGRSTKSGTSFLLVTARIRASESTISESFPGGVGTAVGIVASVAGMLGVQEAKSRVPTRGNVDLGIENVNKCRCLTDRARLQKPRLKRRRRSEATVQNGIEDQIAKSDSADFVEGLRTIHVGSGERIAEATRIRMSIHHQDSHGTAPGIRRARVSGLRASVIASAYSR